MPTAEDADRLGAINAATWRHAYSGLVPDAYLSTLDAATMRERWVTRIAQPDSDMCCLLAEVDGAIASYAIGGGYRAQHDADPREDTAGWGELYALYTHPDVQRRGAGGAVHAALLDRLRARGFSVAGLWVLRDNFRARRWYADHGWRPDGTSSQWVAAGEALEEVRLVRRLDSGRPG